MVHFKKHILILFLTTAYAGCIEPCKIFDEKNCLLCKLHAKIKSKYIFNILLLPIKDILYVCIHKNVETVKVANCGRFFSI